MRRLLSIHTLARIKIFTQEEDLTEEIHGPFQISVLLWGKVTSISLRANKGKDFSPKTKDSYQGHNKDLLSLSIGPSEKQESRRYGPGKETVGGEEWLNPEEKLHQDREKLTSRYLPTVLRASVNPAIMLPGTYLTHQVYSLPKDLNDTVHSSTSSYSQKKKKWKLLKCCQQNCW